MEGCVLAPEPKVIERRQVYNGAPPLSDLVAEDGQTWLEYRKALKPDYALAWRQVSVCYLMLAAGYALNVVIASFWGVIAGMAAAPLTALWSGFWLHGLNQFAHEGSHGNLARGRQKNDLLSDWLLWSFFAQTVRSYRRSHMQHHVHLGDHLDTEINYHECMDPWFFVKGLTGIQMILMVVRYLVKPKAAGTNAPAAQREFVFAFLRTALLHAGIIGVSAVFGFWGAAATWLLGVAVVYPCLGTARQILEHRVIEAPCSTDFTEVEHGPVNRWFGDDLFSRYFGAAGLNRHLLHHWDPGVSYTRLRDMEAFVMRTPYAAALADARGTYFGVAASLIKAAKRK